ncbi:DUF2336 domain-containing protein [Pararhizobium sp. BT-229]|uniref:DUF2336 domain-containing protein n=1 Tax=Pararhizobium sp. BT-229 TaxID=2986923 RepID=UPI0021F7451A|nr:DUF2336 domain-containing protein [Pararhizobium sp. BT-229]MCV9963440.1 DUF2336 domain-containing protein [Pararhizobium sp. BT-229]
MFCVRVGVSVADRFRELERPQTGRLKDVVLMATVSGFEGLRHPRRNDLKQFAELFEPLFSASSDEARRHAAAALSQCLHVPRTVALQIGNAPISIAAIFLTRSVAIDDATLLHIIRSNGPAHATAIARRDNLSVHVVDALVERRQTGSVAATIASLAAPEEALQAPRSQEPDDARLLREEKLRSELKILALRTTHDVAAGPVIEPANPLHEALLVRFARTGEANLFAASLAAALSASVELGERILLDVSGQQLAMALTALELKPADSLFVLGSLYPDLAERFGGTTRAGILLSSLTPETSRARIQSWLLSEQETAPEHQSYLAENRGTDPRQTAARQVKTANTVSRQKRSFGRGH